MEKKYLIKGMGTSPGIVKGKVRLIKNGKEKFDENDILVTRITSPLMIHIMNKASGIICEIGGMTSHPSIVSRELGIPCVVSVNNVTKVLKDGDIIEMDGTKGIIKIRSD